MTEQLARLLSFTRFASDTLRPDRLCVHCLEEELREELAALSWGASAQDEAEGSAPER